MLARGSIEAAQGEITVEMLPKNQPGNGLMGLAVTQQEK